MSALGFYFGPSLTRESSTESLAAGKSELVQVTTEMTGAPVIVDGKVLGYLVFRLRSAVDVNKLPNSKFEVAPYVINAAFQVAYEHYQHGIPQIAPSDIEGLAKEIMGRTNENLHSPAVRDVELEQFNYVPMDKVRQNIFANKQ